MTTASPHVIISYSHADQMYLNRLELHLRPHVREGTISLWVDTHIQPGDDWRKKIDLALISAQVAILLVSVNFLASDFVAKEELPALLKATQKRGLVILPVSVNSCLLPSMLCTLQFVNDPKEPLSLVSEAKQDIVWKKVVELVLGAVQKRSIAEPKDPPRTRLALVVNRLNKVLGPMAFLAVLVAIVVGKIVPDQLESTNTLGFIAYYVSLGICCSECYVFAVYRQWLWAVGLLVVGAGVYLSNNFFVFGGPLYYVVATSVPLVFRFGQSFISRRTMTMKPYDH